MAILEIVKPTSDGYHGGGDNALVRNFVRVMNADTSVSTLMDGLQSAYTCMKMRKWA